MEESSSAFLSLKRYAVVTGANKGIGFEICRRLASKGVTVVLTSRNEKRGLEAHRKLKEERSPALPGGVIFHQLDVADPKSINALAGFIKAQFGKLDILVHKCAADQNLAIRVGGCIIDAEALRVAGMEREREDWCKIATETYELSQECLEVNYYGAKQMVDALIHLLWLSNPILRGSSMFVHRWQAEGWAKEVLGDAEKLTEDRIDEVLKKFRIDFKEGSLEINGWSVHPSVYMVSKAAMNAYTRILAREYPSFCINCVCPGWAKTDTNLNLGYITADEAARGPVRLALPPKSGSPSGRFFVMEEESSFE